jgi:hypothetical protein
MTEACSWTGGGTVVGGQPLLSDAGGNGAYGEKLACCHGVGGQERS